ncbi:DNA translocase FtsK [Pediococcus claussenii]|uniref:DNA translocase FtsK n=1 Tax=Pediococcus claussenii (strain ATCC BAA-344 / DSM 14800 / JCM 18046 / KCTC 3811 / LMG 21948 / P06) TaxID=701521 RepID=G8PCT7_PEDCP|nr:DNA translocase FtsK [Pediococcus claussenii]AEV95072.1 DNA translocase ftsK [Pediococcus claussenii ATCC BAA-344]ANZ70260.1 cell division protein FtsK [Pediococcus claussenii]ANZ72076.1 cell division protein FtsK [Pediococcus claussenii]KRN18933.1 ftsK protein [Pediococcus claussenii]
MAKKRKKKRQTVPAKNIWGLVFVLVGLLGFFDAGFIGIVIANMVRFFVGNTSQVVFAILTIYGGYLLFTGKEFSFKKRLHYVWGLSLIYMAYILFEEINFVSSKQIGSNFLNVTINAVNEGFIQQTANNPVGGGVIGASIFELTHFAFTLIGVWVVCTLLFVFGIVVLFNIPIDEVLENIAIMFGWLVERLVGLFNILKEKLLTVVNQMVKKQTKTSNKIPKRNRKDSFPKEVEPKQPIADHNEPIIVDGTSGVEHKTAEPTIEVASDKMKNNNVKKTDSDSGFGMDNQVNPDYKLPSTNLLTKTEATDQSGEYDAIKKNTKILQETLNSFGVDATVESVKLGPSVTEYELHPAIGVKVSKVVGLADDIALALAAKDIRIEAPIPGKSLIGIEVPNQHISPVGFRDVIEAQAPHSDAPLQVPIGRDVSGNLVLSDLVKMQHLLIAGATGSGKSVMINVIITGLLMNARPDEVKFILIDPKKVELGVYNDIPHLLTPVVTDSKKAARALHKVVAEMQRRYDLFAEANVRNIKGYNDLVDDLNQDGKQRPHLPYIVVIVDELSDLMMVASNEVEDAIIRLAQLARAAGIHMIIATQRPSVDVVTGLIKANVPSRIAFAVASGTDSRTIIDQNGAEKLLGRGDMLYFPMGQNKPERVQGAFISDDDVKRVIAFVKNQQDADYDDDLVVTDEETNQSEADSEIDEYYEDAVELVVDMQKASTSMLQRKFRIGYNRAARLIDELEERGIIGPQEGSKPRKVYRQKE